MTERSRAGFDEVLRRYFGAELDTLPPMRAHGPGEAAHRRRPQAAGECPPRGGEMGRHRDGRPRRDHDGALGDRAAGAVVRRRAARIGARFLSPVLS